MKYKKINESYKNPYNCCSLKMPICSTEEKQMKYNTTQKNKFIEYMCDFENYLYEKKLYEKLGTDKLKSGIFVSES